MIAFASAVELTKARRSRIREIADASVASLRRETYRIISSLAKLPISTLRDSALLHDHLAKQFAGSGVKSRSNSWQELYSRVFAAGAAAGVDALRGRAVRKDIATVMTFDLTNPQAILSIRTSVRMLITRITQEQTEIVREVLVAGQQGAATVREQAQSIRSVVGLSDPQTRALANYRRALETGNYRATLNNALRDKRYDARTLRALAEGSRLSRDQIDQMVSRYAERLRKHRSDVIARTETLRAANAGQLEAWRQAMEQNLLPDSMRMRVIVARDERNCPNCPRIPGMNPAAGVPIGEMFVTPWGRQSGPPFHVMCRCTVGLN
jgi:hypothetical protein